MSKTEKNLPAIREEEGGKIARQDYFRFLKHNLDDYSKIAYTEEETFRIQAHLRKLSTGSSAMVPIFCGGRVACPFADRCPLVAMGKEPLGLQCILEVQLMNHWVMQYMDEYDVDPENFTEVSYCNELAEIEVMMRRLNMSIARPQNAELVIDQAVGISGDGTPIIQKQLSPFMEQKEKLNNRKSKIIKLMVGDRQEKYKKEAALKQRDNQDPSSKQAETRRRIEELQRSLDKVQQVKPTKDTEDKILTPDAIIAASDDE